MFTISIFPIVVIVENFTFPLHVRAFDAALSSTHLLSEDDQLTLRWSNSSVMRYDVVEAS